MVAFPPFPSALRGLLPSWRRLPWLPLPHALRPAVRHRAIQHRPSRASCHIAGFAALRRHAGLHLPSSQGKSALAEGLPALPFLAGEMLQHGTSTRGPFQLLRPSHPRLRRYLGCAALLGLLVTTSCMRPAKPYLKEAGLLSHAGFVAHPANTTARYALMNSLPPGSLTYRMTPDGQHVYLYADPLACGCVYMGDEAAYQTLQIHERIISQRKHRRNSSQEPTIPAMTAENYRDTTPWDWTVWSPAADPDNNQPRHMLGNYW